MATSKTLKIDVTKTDGQSATYSILPKTIVAFERNFGCGIGALTIPETRRMEHVYWLAWDAEKTAGKVVKPFDEWLETVADIDVANEAAPLDEAAIRAS